MSHLKNHHEDDSNDLSKINPIVQKMSMEMMEKVGKEMMTKTTTEIKSLSMML
jgi:hypothetical protein